MLYQLSYLGAPVRGEAPACWSSAYRGAQAALSSPLLQKSVVLAGRAVVVFLCGQAIVFREP